MKNKTRILFVCHGNICRSPLAEAVFRKLVQDSGISHEFEIDSAGISSYHAGEAPDPRTYAEASARGVTLEHSSRPVRAADLEQFDYILGMDDDNMAGIERLIASVRSPVTARTGLLRSYDPMAASGAEVPDPYYGGERGFADVHDVVHAACIGLLNHLRSERGI